MSLKYTLSLLLLVGSFSLLMGQDSKFKSLSFFDEEAFNERFKNYNPNETDSLKQNQKAFAMIDRNVNAMRWLEVHEEDMAKMPNMSINKDFHYTIRIKKFESQHFDEQNNKRKPVLKIKKLPEPIKKP